MFLVYNVQQWLNLFCVMMVVINIVNNTPNNNLSITKYNNYSIRKHSISSHSGTSHPVNCQTITNCDAIEKKKKGKKQRETEGTPM